MTIVGKSVAAAGVAAAGLIASTPAAALASGPYVCKNNEICLYDGYNKTGSVIVYRNGTLARWSDLSIAEATFQNGTSANDAISSIDNRTSDLTVTVWWDAGFNSAKYSQGPNSFANLTLMNNVVSSYIISQ